MLFKLLTSILFLIFLLPGKLYACPGCAGSMGNPNDLKLVWILTGFIVLIYIPMFALFKMIMKYKNVNAIGNRSKHGAK